MKSERASEAREPGIGLAQVLSFRWERGLPRLVLPDRFETPVKWTLWVVTGISIISSAFVFSAWYYAVGFSIAVLALTTFLQRTVFQYASMYVQPLPSFDTSKMEWTGMAYGFVTPRRAGVPDILTPTFSTEEMARQFNDLLREWNNGEDEDQDNNICISIIYETSSRYSCFIYPNPNRKRVTRFQKRAERWGKKHAPNKEHRALVFSIVFCKTFPYDSSSNVLVFERTHQPNAPFAVQPAVCGTNASELRVLDARPLIKWHIKIKRRDDLEPTDFEYNYLKKGNSPLGG